MIDFLSGLSDPKNRKDFFGPILISQAIIWLSVLCLRLAVKPDAITIIIPVEPDHNAHHVTEI